MCCKYRKKSKLHSTTNCNLNLHTMVYPWFIHAYSHHSPTITPPWNYHIVRSDYSPIPMLSFVIKCYNMLQISWVYVYVYIYIYIHIQYIYQSQLSSVMHLLYTYNYIYIYIPKTSKLHHGCLKPIKIPLMPPSILHKSLANHHIVR